MTAAEPAGGFALPYAGDLPGQIEERYVQLGALPPATQRLMLLAAADPTGDAMLLCAAQTLGIEREAAIPADAEQLLEIGTRVRFRHPLVTSAVYRAAPQLDRRAVHLALAAPTDPSHSPRRAAWPRRPRELPDTDVHQLAAPGAVRPCVVAGLPGRRVGRDRGGLCSQP